MHARDATGSPEQLGEFRRFDRVLGDREVREQCARFERTRRDRPAAPRECWHAEHAGDEAWSGHPGRLTSAEVVAGSMEGFHRNRAVCGHRNGAYGNGSSGRRGAGGRAPESGRAILGSGPEEVP